MENYIICERCNSAPPPSRIFPDDVSSWICSRCSMGLVHKKETEEEEYLDSVSPETLKKAIKESDVKTIKRLALYLKLHPQKIYQFTAGNSDCPKPVVDWFYKVIEGE